MISVVLMLAAQPSGQSCDLSDIRSARLLYETLAHRAVEVISSALVTGASSDVQLGRLLAPTANFSLGAGDVGRPLGTGAIGAQSLAAAMAPDQYRFLGYDYMDGPADGCGRHAISVEFVSSADKRISHVEFQFEMGRVTSASGWQRSFVSGSF